MKLPFLTNRGIVFADCDASFDDEVMRMTADHIAATRGMEIETEDAIRQAQSNYAKWATRLATIKKAHKP